MPQPQQLLRPRLLIAYYRARVDGTRVAVDRLLSGFMAQFFAHKHGRESLRFRHSFWRTGEPTLPACAASIGPEIHPPLGLHGDVPMCSLTSTVLPLSTLRR